jgi:bifunctional ADP-heptose synthase (sugar kinase/adenylyltransferase)
MKNILVIGESCKDIFVYCDANRLAPDLPIPVLNIVRTTENQGMARNVYSSIYNYCAHNNLDWSCVVVTNPNWKEVTKTRFVHDATNHTFLRVDANDKIPRINESMNFEQFDIIVISDYNKGFLTEKDITIICETHPKVFLDTKKKLDTWADKAFIIKINDHEYKTSQENFDKMLSCDNIIHTMGQHGAKYKGTLYPVNKVEVKDSTGAGDAFMASLVVKYIETEDIEKSITFANERASESVKHRGVTSI